MSTSGAYTFSVSRDDIIRQALLNIKRLDAEESPTATETTDCARVLNMMCKQWMGKSDFAPGLKVWTRKTFYLMLSNETGAYTVGPSAIGWTTGLTRSQLTASSIAASTSITVDSVTGIAGGYFLGIQLDSGDIYWTTVSSVAGLVVNFTSGSLPYSASSGNWIFVYQTAAQKPLNIEAVWLRDEYNSDTPLRVMNVQDYSYLSDKNDPTNEGDPTAIYYEEGLTSGVIYTDVGAAQDVSKYIVIKGMEPVQDFVNPLDTPYYPQEWYLALCWGLSEQIAPMFGASWNDKQEQLKNSSLAIARNKGAEMSTLYFQPGNNE